MYMGFWDLGFEQKFHNESSFDFISVKATGSVLWGICGIVAVWCGSCIEIKIENSILNRRLVVIN
jgi:hypothetical protein